MAGLEVTLDADVVQPADLVSGWARVSGVGFAGVLVGLFGRDVDGGVFGETFVAPVGEGGRARFVVPVPPDAAPVAAEDAVCMVLCRLATPDGGIAAEAVTPVTVSRVSPARAAALGQYAAALAALGERPEEALAALEAAAGSLTGYAPVHALLGDLLWSVRGDETGARRAWGVARRTHPLALDDGFADWRMALHVSASGELARAKGLLGAALRAAPSPRYREALAAVLWRLGDAAGAESELRRALEARDSVEALRGLMNLADEAGRSDDVLALGERLYLALGERDDEAAADALREHCEYFYLVARAAVRRGFKGAARRWVGRYFDRFDPGERASGHFTGSPFAQHGDEDWFVEAAAAMGHRREDDPWWRHLEAQRAKAAAPKAAGAPAPAAPGEGGAVSAPGVPPGYRVLPSGLILGPRFFEARDAEALRARWGAAAEEEAKGAGAGAGEGLEELHRGPTPALSRRGAERWDTPIFDPAFRKKEGR